MLWNSTFCPHNVFTRSVWIWEQTAIIFLYRVDWLVFITEMECVYCAVRTGSVTIIRLNSVLGVNLRLSENTTIPITDVRSQFPYERLMWSCYFIVGPCRNFFPQMILRRKFKHFFPPPFMLYPSYVTVFNLMNRFSACGRTVVSSLRLLRLFWIGVLSSALWRVR